MKKLLNISVIAAMAILPLAANATVVAGDPASIASNPPTGQTAENVTATAAPKYQLAEADSNVDGVVVTAGYVKGAYNAAIKAINKVSDDAATAAGTAEQNAKNYADGLATNYDAAGTASAAASAVETKLTTGGGANGYAINAQTLKVQGVDVVTTSGAATLTNKTIDANGTGNSITNLETDNFASGALATQSGGGMVTNTSTASDTKLVTEKAVANALATAVTGQVTLDATQTLTNKTIDADNNTIQDLTTTNFKTGTVVTTVGATGADTSLPTEKAVRSAISSATSNLATQTGAAATAAAAVNGAKIDFSQIQATTSNLTGTVPVMDTWGATTVATNPVSVNLSQNSVVTGLTGNVANVANKISAGTVTYTAGN